MGRRNRAALLATNLPQLQNLIKRDPDSYKEDFLQQYRHYQSSLAIFKLKPDEEAKDFADLVTFVAQVSNCYPKESESFPKDLMDLLTEQHHVLNAELRRTLVQNVVLLRNKDVISSTSLLSLLFTLFRCRDKSLREMLHFHIVNDVKNANAKTKNNRLNKTLQSFMYTMLSSAEGSQGTGSESAVAAKKSVDVCIELYKKNVWNDAKTVNVIAHACFSPVNKVAVTAIKFFLGSDYREGTESSDDEDAPDMKKIYQAQNFSKKTKAKARQLDKALATMRKKRRAKRRPESFNFSALQLINDPQDFVEKMYKKLASSKDRFEIKLLMAHLISRLIGLHQLCLPEFYPYLLKYLEPKQRDVTHILTYSAMASHELVPPEWVTEVVMAIANKFVTDNVADEVVSAGLNAIREICARCPLAMNDTLLQDLAGYKKHRDKGVMMAARSLISLYREANPELLSKKDRGKDATISRGSIKQRRYGEQEIATHVEGMELLGEHEEGHEGEEPGDGWEDLEIDAGSDDAADDGSDDDGSDDGSDESDGGSVDAPANGSSKRKRDTPASAANTETDGDGDDEIPSSAVGLVDINAIIGHRKKRKATYEERMASIQEGREGREKFGSRKGKEDRGSSTNKEKAKKKAFKMVAHKKSVLAKSKMSLRQKQIQLQQHIAKQKKHKGR